MINENDVAYVNRLYRDERKNAEYFSGAKDRHAGELISDICETKSEIVEALFTEEEIFQNPYLADFYCQLKNEEMNVKN